jgi:hypothetical protein
MEIARFGAGLVGAGAVTECEIAEIGTLRHTFVTARVRAKTR